MRCPLNAPIKYASLFYRGIAPGERYCRGAAMLTLRLYFRRHFKAATNVPPLDHVRVAPAGECALRAEFFLKGFRRPTFGRSAAEVLRRAVEPLFEDTVKDRIIVPAAAG